MVGIELTASVRDEELLRFATSVERASERPLADAVVRTAKEREITLDSVQDFDSPTVKDVTGTVAGHRIAMGNARFLKELGVELDAAETKADLLSTR